MGIAYEIGMGQAGGWKPLRIGGGGAVTGLDIAVSDGSKVVRTDVYGAYRWSGTEWVQVVTSETMPIADVIPDNYAGVWEIRIAPSSTSTLYMVYLGYIYKSTDSGATWTKTAKTQISGADANGSTRTRGQNMAVDPANANVVYVGTPTAGVWYTVDGGTNWTQIVTGTITHSTTGHWGIAFDPASGTTDGKTNTIYVPSYGNGVWRTTNAGSSWSQLSGAPTGVTNGKVANAKYYCCAGYPYKYDGSWTQIFDQTKQAIAVDPFNAGYIVTSSDGGTLHYSTNDGSSWTNTTTNSHVANDIPWLAWTDEDYFSTCDIEYDPLVEDKLWCSQGIGVWYCDPTTIVPGVWSVTWYSQTLGIEELVSNWIWHDGGAVHMAFWDRAVFRSTDPDVFPSVHGPVDFFTHGHSVESAIGDDTFLVCCAAGNTEESAYSDDGGVTWTSFSAYPPWTDPGHGHIAVSTSTNWVWSPANAGAETNGRAPYYTKNGGASWSKVSLPGVPDTKAGWLGMFFNDWWSNRHVVTADRVDANTFYIYHADYGLFRSTDSGDNWTEMSNGPAISYDWYDAQLRSVPGKEGHLFYTTGPAHGSSHPVSASTFQRSTNSGTTWTTVSNVLEVWAFGFGKEAPGQSYPAIYVAGWVSSEWGLWRSTDECSTWTKIASFPLDLLDGIKSVEGDKDTYGRVYVGFTGSGCAYYGL